MPTGRAHGLTIVKSCEAFANAGSAVTLVLLRRKNGSNVDIFGIYSVPKIFSVRYLLVPEFLYRSTSQMAFTLQTAVFYICAFFFMLFENRKDTIIYTREFPITLLRFVGFKVVFECHTISHKRRLFFWFCRRASRIITISGALKRTFVNAGFADGRIMVAPSGVDLSIFAHLTGKGEARDALGLSRDEKIVLYTGNFTTMGEDKGIIDIIRALKELPDTTFVAVGGGEPDIVRFNKLAVDEGVEARVRLLPHAPQAVLANYQQAADILLMPFPDTPHYRNHMSPVKMFEYMASGRPIIASDLPTIREVLNDTNAVIVPPGDPRSLAAAMRGLFDDPARSEMLARQARSDVERYAWGERARSVLTFIGA